MLRKPFKVTHPATPHFVGGPWLNDVGNALNHQRLYQRTDHQQTLLGIAFCTDHGDDCAAVTDPTEDDVKAPCYSQHKYLAKFRAYNPSEGDYFSFTDQLAPSEEYPVDLSAWWPPSVTSGPILLEDEIFPCFYDVQRGMLVPLWVPMVRTVMLSETLAAGGSADAEVFRKNSSGNDESTSKTITVRAWDLNSEESYVSGIKGFAHWHVNSWIFTSPACFPDDTGLAD